MLTDAQLAKLSPADLHTYFQPCLDALDLERDHAPYQGERPAPKAIGSVYFIQHGEAGPIKIGVAKDPAKRLANLQTSHFEVLRIRALTGGGYRQEREYHVRFAEHRLEGEWFSPHDDILGEIERLRPNEPTVTIGEVGDG